MTKLTNRSPLACTAIAAVLAAVSTPALAQETTAPDPAPAADPAPVAPAAAAPAPIVIPEFKTAPVAQPAPQPVAEPEVAVATTATQKADRSPARTVARTAPAAAAAPVAAQVSPPSSAAPNVELGPPAAADNPAPLASAEPAVAPTASTPDDNTAEIGLGLLGLAALGGLGAYAARRRRTVSDSETMIAAAPMEPASIQPEPVAERPVQRAFAPAFAAAAPVAIEREPERAPVPAGGSASMIPAGPLPSGAALADLFERMARAEPDVDNPFKGDKRRRARVRWLMKQHEYSLRNQATEGFDFRKYAPSGKLAADEGESREVVPA